MGSAFSTLLKLFVGFPFAALFAVGVAYYARIVYVQPDYNKDFGRVDGLDGPVTITRDAHGFPHIHATSRRDALFGQGFAHGQDRLWQVEFQRMVGRGQLSTIVGSLAKLMDTQVRTLNFPAGAERMCRNAPAEEQMLMQRYMDGLNYYVDNNLERPAEFVFMGAPFAVHKPLPFTKTDGCLIAMLLMWQMGMNVPFEVDRFKIFWNTNRTFDETMELYNSATNVTGTILTAEQMGLGEEDAVAARAREAKDNALEKELYDSYFTDMRAKLNPSHVLGAAFGREAHAAYAEAPPAAYPRPDRPRTLIRRYTTSSSVEEVKQQKKKAAEEAMMKKVAPSLKEGLDAINGGDLREQLHHQQQRQQHNDANQYDLRKKQQNHASNAWVGRRAATADGQTFSSVGASDPHLQITNPSSWYWSHLTWNAPTSASSSHHKGDDNNHKPHQYDVAGVGLPGLPGVHIGKTTFTSWGITMSVTDLADLYVIQPDPSRPATHYIVNNTAIPYTIRTEVIKVKGAADVTVTVKDTIYGPIVTDALELPAGIEFAYYTDFLRNDTTSVVGLMCLNSPATTDAIILRDECLSRIRSPGFSIPSTDADGNLVYGITGAHPHRKPGHTGRWPTLGNGTFDHWGVIPYAELPAHTIPAAVSAVEGGYIAAANQKIHPDGYKHSLSYDYIGPQRGQRLHDVLSANPAALSDVGFHRDLQQDVRSNSAAEMFALFAEAKADPSRYPEVAVMLKTIAASANGAKWLARLTSSWDLQMVIGTVEGTFYWRWWRELMRTPSDAIWAYDTDTAYWATRAEYYPRTQLVKPTPTMTRQCREFHQLNVGPLGASGCGEMAGRIFNNLAAEFTAVASSGGGGNVWGIDYNKLTQLHVMLERTPLARFFQNSVANDGDPSSVDVSDVKIDGNMPGNIAPSMRMLYDWAAPTWVRFSFPAGNSGNVFSRFYANMLAAYRDGQYAELSTTAGRMGEAPARGGGAHSQQSLRPQ